MAETQFGDYVVDYRDEENVSILFNGERVDITGGDAVKFVSECEDAFRREYVKGEQGAQEKTVSSYFEAYNVAT